GGGPCRRATRTAYARASAGGPAAAGRRATGAQHRICTESTCTEGTRTESTRTESSPCEDRRSHPDRAREEGCRADAAFGVVRVDGDPCGRREERGAADKGGEDGRRHQGRQRQQGPQGTGRAVEVRGQDTREVGCEVDGQGGAG